MNALYKILSLLACALLVFKLNTWPAHQSLASAKTNLAEIKSRSDQAQRMLEFALALPAYPVQLHGPDQALSLALDSVHAEASNHGIKITQVIARDVPITQQVFATANLHKEDPATNTLSQKLLIKATYIDLASLRKYLTETISPAKGMVISDLLIKEDTLEIGLGIHSDRAIPQASR